MHELFFKEFYPKPQVCSHTAVLSFASYYITIYKLLHILVYRRPIELLLMACASNVNFTIIMSTLL